MDTGDEGPSPVGIALSGGGTRAAMMGVGAVRRLYELGILRRATTISSVSGGSIVNGHKLNPVRMVKRVKSKMKRELGFTPTHLGLHLAKYIPAMDIKLSELPKPRFSLRGGVPRFVFCGCDLSTGKPFYFSQEIVGHGLSKNMKVKSHSGAYPILSEDLPKAIPLTQAVGASAAVPLVFEPLQITVEVNNDSYTVGIVDGAVYDNLGLDPLIGEDNAIMLEGCEKAHKVIFVNDAGAPWFLPLDRFTGKHVVRRVTRALTIALSRGHDERVRFLDLMYKRHLLYGAYWRIGDLEKLFDKFTEEELAAMKDLCFPSKQMLDPLLIARVLEFRTDLNELKPAEIRVLENSGYILAAFKFHQYVVPLLKDKDLVDTSNFSAEFRFPMTHEANDIQQELRMLADELKNSYSLIKSNLKPKHILRRKRSAFECQFQLPRDQATRVPYSETHESVYSQDESLFEIQEEEIYEDEENGEGEEVNFENRNEVEYKEGEYEEGEYEEYVYENETGRQEEKEEGNGKEESGANGNCNYPYDPNHPLYRIEPSKKLYDKSDSSLLHHARSAHPSC